MDPRPGRRRASREGRRFLADAAERAARRPRARRALRRARHLRAAARGVPAGGLGGGGGDPRTLTRRPPPRIPCRRLAPRPAFPLQGGGYNPRVAGIYLVTGGAG